MSISPLPVRAAPAALAAPPAAPRPTAYFAVCEMGLTALGVAFRGGPDDGELVAYEVPHATLERLAGRPLAPEERLGVFERHLSRIGTVAEQPGAPRRLEPALFD